MIQIIDTSGVLHPISNYERFHITHKQDGNDICSFILNTALPEYSLIREEAVIRTYENEYLIKKIDDDKIDCKLNFDFLKQQFYKNFASRTKTLAEVLAAHLPSGWTVQGADVSTIRRSITFDYCTDYDVVMACPDVYDVKFIWHILEKRLVVVKPDLANPSGEYVTSDLNLRKLSFKGQSVDFATRLYAYGKNGLTLEEAIVDGQRYGLEYVDDNTYSDKVVVAYWKDERYTIPDNLYDDAVIKLAALSQPARSYECRIDDLAKRDERYRFLDFSMHKVIALLDSERKIAINHQIVEYDEWPDEPQENNVTLSCVPDTIQETIHTVAQQLQEEIDEQKEAVKAEFEVQDEKITAKVSKTGGQNTSFGWTLTETAHKWFANNREVMSIDQNGLSVVGSGTFTGEIRASSGYIGNSVNGFSISSRAIANGMESLSDTTHNGVYVGTDGIALGAGKFKVTASGSVTAKDLALTGGSISLGDDGSGNPVFKVTSSGAVTAKNLILTGGSINIGDRFIVSSTGYLTADFTGGSITLGRDASNNPMFQVTSGGVVTAKSLNLSGGTIQLGDDGNGNPVFKVTSAGAVTAKNLTLTGGSINIADRFKVSTTGYLTADFTGGSITLGRDSNNNPIFQVTSGGVVTAKSLNLTGGTIQLGDDGTQEHNPVFKVTNAGAVTAKNLTLTGGTINIADTFKVSSTGILTANMTGGSITLGQNFAVTNTGAVTAKNLTLTGGSISLGTDANNNPIFHVTSGGVVTAKSLNLNGGSININDKFIVSSTGVMTADMTGGSITLGQNFAVTSSGAVTAKNLTLTGGSISLGDDGTDQHNPVFHVTSAGAVTAKNLTLTGGAINIANKFVVTAAGSLTADMTGGSITLGQNFSVSSTGAVTAKNLTLTGGSISLGNDGNDNPVFAVSTGGAVTAKNLSLTGGSINIKDGNGDTAFSVSGTGAVTASNLSITGGTININSGAFRVDADGNLYANSGSFGGTVNAENIQSTGVQGTGGYLSGSALSDTSVGSGKIVSSSLTTGQFASGVNTSLGYANAYNSATQQGTNTYPTYFSAGQVIARSSFYSSTYYIYVDADHDGTINSHTHQITANNDGTVTIGAPDFLGNPHSFNIADTAFYQAAISARTVRAITAGRDTAEANITWNSTAKTLTADFTLTAKNATGASATVLYTESEYPISMPATKAYNAGKTDYEPTSITASRETSDANVVWNSTNKTISADFTFVAKNSGNTAVLTTTENPITLPATKAYNAGKTDYQPTSITATRETSDANVVWNSTAKTLSADFTLTAKNAANASVLASTGNSITLPATKAYNAGVQTAFVGNVSITANGVHISSGGHHYTRTTVKATAKGTYANGSTYTATEQTISSSRDVNADDVYAAGKTDYQPTSITASRETTDANVVWNGSAKTLSADFTFVAKNAANSSVLTSTGNPISLPATKAYNAGQDYGAGTVAVLGTSYLTTTVKNAHKTSGIHHYINVDITPTARAEKSDGTYSNATNTINRDILADTVYSDGVTAGAGSVTQRSVDEYNCTYRGGSPYSTLRVYFTDGNYQDITVPQVYDGYVSDYNYPYDAGYNAGAASVSQRTVSSCSFVSGSNYTQLDLNYDDGTSQRITLPTVWNSYLMEDDSLYNYANYLGYRSGYQAAVNTFSVSASLTIDGPDWDNNWDLTAYAYGYYTDLDGNQQELQDSDTGWASATAAVDWDWLVPKSYDYNIVGNWIDIYYGSDFVVSKQIQYDW